MLGSYCSLGRNISLVYVWESHFSSKKCPPFFFCLATIGPLNGKNLWWRSCNCWGAYRYYLSSFLNKNHSKWLIPSGFFLGSQITKAIIRLLSTVHSVFYNPRKTGDVSVRSSTSLAHCWLQTFGIVCENGSCIPQRGEILSNTFTLIALGSS